jgi:phosphohistidine phosphatase SixA
MARIILALLAALALSPAAATEAGWALLRDGGHIVLLRHAMATGMTDPANFDIENCATQRNLSDRGKQQARKIGALFAARAAEVERVLASRYCRTFDTARFAFGDRGLEKFEPLDLLAIDGSDTQAKTAAVMQEIRSFTGSGNMVLVTHLENIKALTGENAREGEAVIVRIEGDHLHILGRIIFN